MDILLTGADGYCGRNILGNLSNQNHTIWATTRSPLTKAAENDLGGASNIIWIETDLTEPKDFPERIDAIIHTAAKLSFPDVLVSELVRDNVDATRKLIEYAVTSQARTMVFFSAMSVYGNVKNTNLSEAAPPSNPNIYGLSKLIGEQMLAERAEELSSLILRLPAIVGPQYRHGWLKAILYSLKKNEPVQFVNPDTPFNNAIHVEDLADFLIKIIELDLKGSQTLNLASNGNMTIGDMVNKMKIGLDSRSDIHTESVPEASQITINHSLAKDKFGWNPRSINDLVDYLIADAKSGP